MKKYALEKYTLDEIFCLRKVENIIKDILDYTTNVSCLHSAFPKKCDFAQSLCGIVYIGVRLHYGLGVCLYVSICMYVCVQL